MLQCIYVPRYGWWESATYCGDRDIISHYITAGVISTSTYLSRDTGERDWRGHEQRVADARAPRESNRNLWQCNSCPRPAHFSTNNPDWVPRTSKVLRGVWTGGRVWAVWMQSVET